MSFKHLYMPIVLLSAALLLTVPLAAAEEDFQSTVRPFLKQYCLGCHGAKKQQGERRFDQLTVDFSKPQNGELLQDILDQLNLGEMPPEDARQPVAAETRRVVALLTKTMAEEWYPHGIRVNSVAPGSVRTPRIMAQQASGEAPSESDPDAARWVEMDDIAGALLFLSSGLAKSVTGQTLVVDSGKTALFPFSMS